MDPVPPKRLRYLFRSYEALKLVKGGEKCLEIGCGNLLFVKELLSRYNSVVGVDFSNTSSKYLSSIPASEESRFTLMQCDFFDVSENFKNEFDLIACFEVLEHVEEDKKLILECQRALKPGGQILISVPAKMKYWSRDDESVGHVRRYERKELVDKIETTGLVVKKFVSYGFPFVLGLRLARIFHEKYFDTGRDKLSVSEQTKLSSDSPAAGLVRVANQLINETSIKMLAGFSSIFNDYDLTDGYLVSAVKPQSSD